MFRKLIPLAVLIVLVVGCKKKGGSSAPAGSVEGDPGAAYTLKVRDEQAGDKTEVVETTSGTTEINFGGKGDKSKEEKRFEYTEHIIDFPAGAAQPTKLTRTYKTAQKYDRVSNALKAAKYEGKTLTVEKKGANYEATADGKKLDFMESAEFTNEFTRKDKRDTNDLLPKSAVKVGESWTIEQSAMKSMLGSMPFPVDAAKSKMSGKLTRAYTKDGKQWGVIAFDFDLAIDSDAGPGGPKAKGRASGSVKAEATLDAVVDGSSRDGTMKMTIKMNIAGKDDKNEMKVAGDMVQEKTVKTVK